MQGFVHPQKVRCDLILTLVFRPSRLSVGTQQTNMTVQGPFCFSLFFLEVIFGRGFACELVPKSAKRVHLKISIQLSEGYETDSFVWVRRKEILLLVVV